MISSERPDSCLTRARNSPPFSAARAASVAISRARTPPRCASFIAQTRNAETARSLAAPNDTGKSVDHAKGVARRVRDQQAAVVGAEVERGIGRAARRVLMPRG